MENIYRYYSLQRPLIPGSFPKSATAHSIFNFDSREYCEAISRPAWGYVEYLNPLTEQEARDYELIRSPG